MKALTAAITTIRRTVAHWLYQPFSVTAWEPERITTTLLPAPAQQQSTGSYTLPSIIDGVAGGHHWPGPAGTWRAVYLHEEPRRRRDTGILVPPVQNSGAMPRLATGHTLIPETRDEFGFAGLPTWTMPQTREKQITDAIARLDRAQSNSGRLDWLYADPPVLQPLESDAPAAGDRIAVRITEEPTSAMVELAEMAARFDPTKTKVSIPAYISKRARELQKFLKESE